MTTDEDSQQQRPVEIVLTGGPGSGKTTGLIQLSERLSEAGYRVFLVPEVASMVITGGVSDMTTLARVEPGRYREVQRNILGLQASLRTHFQALARAFDEPTLILYDRAEMDNGAYLEADDFTMLLDEAELDLHTARDSYDAVIHLVTAADGAEEFYTLENNLARSETAEAARALDARTLQSWVGHPHLRVVDNSTDFEQKIQRCLHEVMHVLGIPEPLEIERKFLLAGAPDFTHPDLAAAVAIDIEQVYLTSTDDREVRVRRRGQRGQHTYFKTEKQKIAGAARIETESIISQQEFEKLLHTADPARQPIRKCRHCFVYRGLYFELDEFIDLADLFLLEVELTHEQQIVELPESLNIEREVTGEREYSNAALAARV